MEENTTDSLFDGRAIGDVALPEVPLTTFTLWMSALGFVTIINLSSVMGIIFFPLMSKSFYTIIMRTMIGLAIGSLSGSALFHLIPAAFGLDSHDGNGGDHSRYLNISLIVWLAAWIVMLLECFIKIGVKMRAHSRKNPEAAPLKITISPATENDDDDEIDSAITPSLANGNGVLNGSRSHLEKKDLDNTESLSRENLPVYRSTLSLSKTLSGVQSDLNGDASQDDGQIKTVAWIIIIGDSLHNFIDGVSIGTAFVKSFHTGAIISLAIMCEEFPHELGDFAILINSGLSVKKALLFNFLSALTCYLGVALGILLGEISWDSYIFAFAAGIFLYVALGDMVPEVTSLTEEVCEISPRRAIIVLLNHNVGILFGVIILYALALFQP